MEYYEVFLNKMARNIDYNIYDNLDIEKMKEIIQENMDYLIKLKGEKAIEEINKFDKSSYLSQVLAYRLFSIKDNIGKIGAWCNYFSDESTYYKWILINFMKKLEKMSKN